jgi:hypothetical protein
MSDGVWVKVWPESSIIAQAQINEGTSNFNSKESNVTWSDGKTYTVYKFTDTTADDLSLDVTTAGMATVLLVAGGGGSGNDAGGGGGGVTPLRVELPVGTLTVGVGEGGLAGNRVNSSTQGLNGLPSWLGRIAAAGGGGGAGAVSQGGLDGASGGGGGRASVGGKANAGEQGHSSNMISGDRAAGGAGGLPTGPTQDDGGPGYTWIDGVTYGAGGLRGGGDPDAMKVPNSGNGGHAPAAEGSSGIVIVGIEA